MYPFPMTMGVGSAIPYPMQATSRFGNAVPPPPGTQVPQKIDPLISDWSAGAHVAVGAVAGVALGWFLWKK